MLKNLANRVNTTKQLALEKANLADSTEFNPQLTKEYNVRIESIKISSRSSSLFYSSFFHYLQLKSLESNPIVGTICESIKILQIIRLQFKSRYIVFYFPIVLR